jgi:hypothetical protein
MLQIASQHLGLAEKAALAADRQAARVTPPATRP